MSSLIPRLFADVFVNLEDRRAIAVEGQRGDNDHDMQSVLNVHLRSGLAAIDKAAGAIGSALEASRS